MPLASVQLYVQGLLDGLLIPGSTKPLKAQVTPPVIQKLSGPMAFVWGGSLVVTRQTGPRGAPGEAGFKKLLWDVDVWLVLLTNPNSSGADQQFPVLVDAVMAQLWTTAMPLFIDGQGLPANEGDAGTSQILEVGEAFRVEYAAVHTPQTQRMLFYDAHLALQIYEAVNA